MDVFSFEVSRRGCPLFFLDDLIEEEQRTTFNEEDPSNQDETGSVLRVR